MQCVVLRVTCSDEGKSWMKYILMLNASMLFILGKEQFTKLLTQVLSSPLEMVKIQRLPQEGSPEILQN